MKSEITKSLNRRVGTLCPPFVQLPRGHKIVPTLPGWLNVSAHWLRYGPPNDAKQKQPAGVRRTKLQAEKDIPFSEVEMKLVRQFRRLSAHQRHLIAELTEQLATDQEIWPEQS